jgi:hypothetical protein
MVIGLSQQDNDKKFHQQLVTRLAASPTFKTLHHLLTDNEVVVRVTYKKLYITCFYVIARLRLEKIGHQEGT